MNLIFKGRNARSAENSAQFDCGLRAGRQRLGVTVRSRRASKGYTRCRVGEREALLISRASRIFRGQSALPYAAQARTGSRARLRLRNPRNAPMTAHNQGSFVAQPGPRPNPAALCLSGPQASSGTRPNLSLHTSLRSLFNWRLGIHVIVGNSMSLLNNFQRVCVLRFHCLDAPLPETLNPIAGIFGRDAPRPFS
ncbi:uncharacterized protein VTP21DRAFT_11071 [Calcarisporiella thermophila]|uniref:uncharacterized protein n=1 Tax=Calcarisporiella thermophila TaxID=911321 RepID=UPI003742AFC2